MAFSNCVYSDSDTPSRYVAGALAAGEAEAFEEHYFGCQRCWQEVHAGSAARAALAHPVRERETQVRPMWWMSLAAAAVLAVVTLVTLRERSGPAGPDVVRGSSEQSMAVVVERAAAQLQIRWRAVPRAVRYEIEARNPEGERLQQKSSQTTAIALDGLSNLDVFIRVTAYDAQGEEIARSPLVRAPSRKP